MEQGSLSGKTAIVTGASSGIGRGSALVLAGAGAQVVVADIDDDGGSETVRLIQAADGAASFAHVDVTIRAQVHAVIDDTVALYGGLDIMHANTGITLYVDLEEMQEADMDRLLGVNLKGALLCAQLAIPAMKSRGSGSIVFTSSVLNTIGFPQCVVYSSTKAALIGLTRTLAVEVGKHNIRVNCVSPGTINTPMLDRDMADHERCRGRRLQAPGARGQRAGQDR